LLWEERIIRSVANLTRQDGIEFFEIISKTPVKTEVQPFPLKEANNALDKLRRGELQGAAVLVVK
jgi:propanol-preferring alcohol dehydrogenase